MFFIKTVRRNAGHYPVDHRHELFAECSKGTIVLTRCASNKWMWMVRRRAKKAKEWPVLNSSSHPLRTYAQMSGSFYGYEQTLYKAARAGLQRLFTYRRVPVTVLMEILVKDQVVYELSKIGTPSGS